MSVVVISAPGQGSAMGDVELLQLSCDYWINAYRASN